MKKSYFLLLSAAMLFSCEQQDIVPEADLTLDSGNIEFEATGGRKVLKITSSYEWTISLPENDWVEVSKTSGQGTDEVVITADANPDRENGREITMTVTSNGKDTELIISQPKFVVEFSVSPEELAYVGSGEDKKVTVTANCDWKVSVDYGEISDEWLTFSVTEGTGDAEITVTASGNGSQERQCTVIFMSGNEKVGQVSVSQDENRPWIRFADTETDKEFECSILNMQETFTVNIESNTEWTVALPDGVTAEPAGADGNAAVVLTVDNSKIQQNTENEVVFSVKDAEGVQEGVSVKCIVEYRPEYANCYIVPAAGTYSFPVYKVDGTKVEGTEADYIYYTESEGFSISDIELVGDRVSFTVGEGEGYATVAVLNGGSVAWSWHIWRTDVPSDVNVGGYWWQDRNLGAWDTNLPKEDYDNRQVEEAYGCFYQWGRKDPFPAVVDAVIDGGAKLTESSPFRDGFTYPVEVNSRFGGSLGVSEDENTPASNTGHPWLFGKNACDPADPSLWQANVKTNNDPCPPGYKVPSRAQADTWTELIDTWDENSNPSNSPGWYKAFYKARDRQFFVMGSGYIDINDNAGKHVWPGRQCMIWTSEMLPDNSKAFMIKWGTEEVTADGTLNKGLADNMRVHSDFTNLGAVVRCVKTDRTK